jgi:hypothetical protein
VRQRCVVRPDLIVTTIKRIEVFGLRYVRSVDAPARTHGKGLEANSSPIQSESVLYFDVVPHDAGTS